ncbi:MAG: DUF4339 domain-containing protein [Proteobacteria bacterium]|nr:DUF4339 domain-containing protein [Pseudomonadota bacterium]
MSGSELRGMLERQQLTMDSLVWRDGLPQWIAMADSGLANAWIAR